MKRWSDVHLVTASGQRIGRRAEQQDRFTVVPFAVNDRDDEGALVVVTDGHSVDGAYAAQTAATRIADGMLASCSRDADAFRESFLGAHDLLVRRKVDGGATATCAAVHPDKVVAAWAGNTEARIIRADGRLSTLTIPHEYGVHRGETARLDATDAVIEGPDALWSDGRLQAERPKRGRVAVGRASLEMTRVLGDPEFDPYVLHEPEVKAHALTPEDRWLLIATDGLWQAAKRTGKRALIGNALAACDRPSQAAQALDALLDRWRLNDNVTYVLVDLRGIA